MEWLSLIPLGVSVISVAIAALTWKTSASKARVENLCAIVESQAQYIKRLETQLQAARDRSDVQDERILSLEEDLESAKDRMVVLERENRWYMRILSIEGIDPSAYCEQREGADGD